jgi:pimeloyl-ACP methyl ester carboxylesterase
VRSAEDVLTALTDFVRTVDDGRPSLLLGHSAGAYYAQAIAARTPELVTGLALICPLLPELRDIPPHEVVLSSGDLGDQGFRDYFVIQTSEMLQRYETLVAPAAALADEEAMERIGKHWELGQADGVPYEGPTLIVAGRRDATVGSRAAMDAERSYPHATIAVVEDAGHALPHEQPELLGALISEWLTRVERGT